MHLRRRQNPSTTGTIAKVMPIKLIIITYIFFVCVLCVSAVCVHARVTVCSLYRTSRIIWPTWKLNVLLTNRTVFYLEIILFESLRC